MKCLCCKFKRDQKLESALFVVECTAGQREKWPCHSSTVNALHLAEEQIMRLAKLFTRRAGRTMKNHTTWHGQEAS